MTYISEALRQQVTVRAKARCEYCRLHEDHAYFTHEIDHIYAEKHGGDTVETNLCLPALIVTGTKVAICVHLTHKQGMLSRFSIHAVIDGMKISIWLRQASSNR